MALAVTHILIPLIVLDLLRHYVFGKEKFPRYLIVIGGIAGLMPDIDIVISWFVRFLTGNTQTIHGVFTHSLFFVLFFLAIAVAMRIKREFVTARIFYVIAFGWFLHIFLDWIFGEYKAIFWPFFSTSTSIFPSWNIWVYAVQIDAVLLVLWLIHEEVHKNVRDYF